MFLPSPCSAGVGPLACCFGRRSRKGLFLCADGKAAAGNGLGVGFVNVRHPLPDDRRIRRGQNGVLSLPKYGIRLRQRDELPGLRYKGRCDTFLTEKVRRGAERNED